MAATTPAKDNTRAPAPAPAEAPLVPPDEQFWQRYSPHSEAPLSAAGSFVIHAAVLGTMVLFAVFLASYFKPNRSLPVDPVRLNLGGGGGSRTGAGEGKGIGHGPEDVGEKSDKDQPGAKADDAPRRPALNPVEKEAVQQKFDAPTARFISKSNNDYVKAFARLDDSIRNKLRDGLNPGKGEGGRGSGGGSGTGTGTGSGAGTGAGRATLNQREKRMLRWHMRFTANTGPEYVSQLAGLGAILAIPISERGPEPEFRVVRDLRKKPAKLENEDLSKIQRIYWIDDKPTSVRDVMAALGLSYRPSRFVAFMPHELEKTLFEMERHHVEKVLKRPFDEDKIDETIFRVVPRGRGFEPVLQEVRMRR